MRREFVDENFHDICTTKVEKQRGKISGCYAYTMHQSSSRGERAIVGKQHEEIPRTAQDILSVPAESPRPANAGGYAVVGDDKYDGSCRKLRLCKINKRIKCFAITVVAKLQKI